MNLPSFEYGGPGNPLHFLHANGYPPDCYGPLLELLKTEYHVFGMLLRPLWQDSKPEQLRSWHPLSDDLLQFLASTAPHNKRSAPLTTVPVLFGSAEKVIGVGHSIGAIVTLRAALRDPSQFKALVLIDPVLFVPRRLFLWHLFRAIGLGDSIHPLIAGAKRRRRTFDDLETVFRGYRNRNIFRYMSDENLRTYIEGMTKPRANGGYELIFSPEWEAQIYRTGLRDFDIWRELPRLKVPTIFLRGGESDTFLENAARLVKQKQLRAKIETLEKSTHLLPLERPHEVFEIIQSFLKAL